MSDLGRLFRLRSSPTSTPLENFTTTALAIAIGHDDRPIKAALQAIDWAFKPVAERAPLAVLDLKGGIERVTAMTQVTLWPADGPLGYLDLVLQVTHAERVSTIWVEVKVDAWEHGSQLENYRTHASTRSPQPAIITLGRTRISEHFPALKWADFVSAIDQVGELHHSWLSLREFLLDEKIARPALEQDVDPNALIDVIVDVNRIVRRRWVNLAWFADAPLRKNLLTKLKNGRHLAARGGPLVYGFTPAASGWNWTLSFSTARHDRMGLDTEQPLRDAARGALSDDWKRNPEGLEVLQRRLPAERAVSHDEIVRWFDEGFEQLHNAGLMDPFLAAVAARTEGNAPPSLSARSPRTDSSILLEAVEFAAFKHREQRRKGADASPYINHPIGVAHLLAGVGGITDVDTLVAAVLHDTIEDTETTAGELEQRFGSAIRAIVQEVTDDKTLEKAVRKRLQIEHAPALSPKAKAVKIADKIMNVRDVTNFPPSDWDLARRLQYLDWAGKVVDGCRGTNEALEDYFDDLLGRGRAALGQLSTTGAAGGGGYSDGKSDAPDGGEPAG